MDEPEAARDAQPGWYSDPMGRNEYRWWNGTAWTDDVANGGERGMDTFVIPLPVTPTSGGAIAQADRPVPRHIARRAIWSVYAIPMSALLVAGSAAAIASGRPYAAFDLCVSLPMLVAVQLHIWDRRALPPLVWRCYAFVMLAWQVAYTGFLGPAAQGARFDPSVLPNMVVQLPMFVGMFLYAFRDWQRAAESPTSTRCPTCGNSFQSSGTCPYCATTLKPRRKGWAAVLIVAGAMCVMALVVAAGLGYLRMPPASLNSIVPRPKPYEVAARPVADPVIPRRPLLSAKERSQLRTLLEHDDFAALDAALERAQRSAEASPSQDRKVDEMYDALSGTDDVRRLDTWVAKDPASFPARLARASYYDAAAGRARGTDLASNTSEEQFDGMRDAFDRAVADADAALAANPALPTAWAVRITAAGAGGANDQFDKVADSAMSACPRSYLVYASILQFTRPRWGGSYKEMERVASIAVASNPSDPWIYGLYGEIYADQADVAWRAERREDALALYSKAISYGERSDWLTARGRLNLGERRYDEALRDADRSLARLPGQSGALLLRASAYVCKGDVKRAMQDADAAERAEPGSPDVKEWRAWAASVTTTATK